MIISDRMERYENSKIYRLVCSDGFFYIGSTCVPLCKRLYRHKDKSKKEPERKVYKHIINLGWENVKIILIEEFQCKNKDELRRREQEEIDKYKTDEKCLNNKNAYGIDKDRRKNYEKVYYKTQYEAHRDECLVKMKDYYESHRDNILEQRKAHWEANKEEINKKRREKYAAKKITSTNIDNAEPRQPEEISEGTPR
jgi:hypothetical protein